LKAIEYLARAWTYHCMQKLKDDNRDTMFLLKDDVLRDEALQSKIKELDHKAQQLLLWSTLCSLFSYLVLIVVIARIYLNYKGQHPVLLTLTLLFMYAAMAILIFATWKSIANHRRNFFSAAKSHIKYQISKLSGQRKLMGYYLLEYSALIGISCCFFFSGIEHGMPLLIRLTAPVSIMTYILGFYFMASFTKQIKKLQEAEKQADKEFFDNINRN
jgi:hypothetical protein